MTSREPTLILLHVPRSGGTTSWRKLGAAFLHARRLGPNYDRNFKEAVAALEGKYRVVASHFPYGAHELLKGPYEYAVVLRDPVARIGSTLKWYLNNARRRNHKEAKEGVVSLVKASAACRNGAVKILCGAGLGFEEKVTKAMFEKARRVLDERIHYVGFTDNLHPWLDSLCAMLGRHEVVGKTGYQLRTGGGSLPFEEHELAVITACNQWDLALYQHAKEKYGNGQP
jgi:hypothetical protein